jgi:hypothetical protein
VSPMRLHGRAARECGVSTEEHVGAVAHRSRPEERRTFRLRIRESAPEFQSDLDQQTASGRMGGRAGRSKPLLRPLWLVRLSNSRGAGPELRSNPCRPNHQVRAPCNFSVARIPEINLAERAMPGSASSSCCPQKPPSFVVLCTTREAADAIPLPLRRSCFKFRPEKTKIRR